MATEWSSESSADDRKVIARDHPHSLIFLQMAARGALDFYILHGRQASGIDEIVSTGNTSYLLPDNAPIELQTEARIVSSYKDYGGPVYWRGRVNGPHRQIGRGLPERTPLQSMATIPPPSGMPEITLPSYAFAAARYLNDGYSEQELDVIQRRLRVVTHTVAAMMEYLAVNQEVPPSLESLESFIGVARNPAGWNGINVVASNSLVERSAGNFYFGPTGRDEFVASIRVTSDEPVYTHRWRRDSSHGWVPTGALLY